MDFKNKQDACEVIQNQGEPYFPEGSEKKIDDQRAIMSQEMRSFFRKDLTDIDLRGSNLSRKNLLHTNFSGSDLRHSNMGYSCFFGTVFQNTNLLGVKLGVDAVLLGQKDDITSLGYSKDGKLFACGYSDGTISIWGVDTGSLPINLKKHTGKIKSLKFSLSGDLLGSVSEDSHTIIWELENCNPVRIFNHGALSIHSFGDSAMIS